MSHSALQNVLPYFHGISVVSAGPRVLHYHSVRTAKKPRVTVYTHYCIFVLLIPLVCNTSELRTSYIFLLYSFPIISLSLSLFLRKNLKGWSHDWGKKWLKPFSKTYWWGSTMICVEIWVIHSMDGRVKKLLSTCLFLKIRSCGIYEWQ